MFLLVCSSLNPFHLSYDCACRLFIYSYRTEYLIRDAEHFWKHQCDVWIVDAAFHRTNRFNSFPRPTKQSYEQFSLYWIYKLELDKNVQIEYLQSRDIATRLCLWRSELKSHYFNTWHNEYCHFRQKSATLKIVIFTKDCQHHWYLSLLKHSLLIYKLWKCQVIWCRKPSQLC